jgi:hypothetical protein
MMPLSTTHKELDSAILFERIKCAGILAETTTARAGTIGKSIVHLIFGF